MTTNYTTKLKNKRIISINGDESDIFLNKISSFTKYACARPVSLPQVRTASQRHPDGLRWVAGW